MFIPEARDQAGNLFWALGHHAALGWSVFGIEDLSPTGQVAEAYELLSGMLPNLAAWQAEGKVNAILVVSGEPSQSISLGGYKITLKGGSTPDTKPANRTELAGGVTSESRSLANDNRAFAIVVNTAPDEFLFFGANGKPSFEAESGSGRVVIASQDEGKYDGGTWVAGRRINGDETFASGLPYNKIGMLKVKLVRIE